MEIEREGWSGVRQIPTFYLNPNVQGIMDAEHAEKIAREILNPLDLPLTLHVFCMKVTV